MKVGINKEELLHELEKALNINELAVFVGAGLSKGAGRYEALWQEYSTIEIKGYMHSLYCLIIKITKEDLLK